jgi:hypothetical protein
MNNDDYIVQRTYNIGSNNRNIYNKNYPSLNEIIKGGEEEDEQNYYRNAEDTEDAEDAEDAEDTEDEFNEDDEIFSDNNPEFIHFKQEVSNWITLDDDIRTLQKAIKERKDKKAELTPRILKFMERFKINDLNTNDGKLKFARSLYTKPLNKKYLISRLGDFFRDYSKGEKVAGYIFDNRDKEEKVRLTRVLDRSKAKPHF